MYTRFTGFYPVVVALESECWAQGFLAHFPSSLGCRILCMSTTDSAIHVHFLIQCFMRDPALPHHCSKQHSLSSVGGWRIAHWGVAKSSEKEGTEECHGSYRSIPSISSSSVTLHLYNMKYYFITNTITFINNLQVDLVNYYLPFRCNSLIFFQEIKV